MRRSIKTLAIAAVALMSLSACAKPAPSVTVFSADKSVHFEALCWTEDGSPAVGSEGCSQADISSAVSSQDMPSLAVQPGKTLGISVDSEVAEAGWSPSIIVNGQAQVLETGVIHKRYWSMTFPESTHGSFPETGYIIQIAADGVTSGSPRGLWFVTITDGKSTDNA